MTDRESIVSLITDIRERLFFFCTWKNIAYFLFMNFLHSTETYIHRSFSGHIKRHLPNIGSADIVIAFLSQNYDNIPFTNWYISIFACEA